MYSLLNTAQNIIGTLGAASALDLAGSGFSELGEFAGSLLSPAALSLTDTLQTPGVLEAFFAGILSFLSPCLLPLIPVYIMYLKTDIGEEDPSEDAEIKKTKFRAGLIRALQFILGFTMVFMLLGLGASSIGRFLTEYRNIITRIAGILVIFFGLTMLGVIRINALTKDYRRMRSTSAIGMGMAFAFGWTPCVGPFLGSILAMTAAVTDHLYQGIFLLFVYSAGLGIPFLLAYIFLELFEKYVGGISKHSATFAKIGAVIMILFGVLLLFNQVGTVVAWFQ